MKLTPEIQILVVDDMRVMQKMVGKELSNIGFKNIRYASDGQEAWQVIEEAAAGDTPVEFIVSDWNMPNMTGLELLQKVRSSDKFAKLPFLMVTAEGEKERIVEAVKAGVSNFIIKPFDTATIKDKIKKIFLGK